MPRFQDRDERISEAMILLIKAAYLLSEAASAADVEQAGMLSDCQSRINRVHAELAAL